MEDPLNTTDAATAMGDKIQFETHRDDTENVEDIVIPIITVLGILANAFVVLVIVVTERSRSNRTVANTFVMNLAIADILFLISLPFYTPSLHRNGYPFSEGMCKFQEALKYISYHSSILFLTGMSMDRYMAIVHSLRSLEYRTQRNARIICSILWLVSIITTIPIMVFSKLEGFMNANGTIEPHSARCMHIFPGVNGSHFVSEDVLTGLLYGELGGDYGSSEWEDYYSDGNETDLLPDAGYVLGQDDPNEFYCKGTGHAGNSNAMSYKIWQYFSFIGFFVIPMLIVLFCYFKIWRATAIRKVRSQKAEGNQENQSLHQNQNENKKLNWKQIQYKVTIMVAVLVFAFIICWFPVQLWVILRMPPGVKVSAAHHCDIVNAVVTMLAWSNSLMNPILYSITSENFRKRAMTTLFYLRYGHRRTMRMSVTRTSRNGAKTEKTDVMLHSVPPGASQKNDANNETQVSPPPTPIEDGPPAYRF